MSGMETIQKEKTLNKEQVKSNDQANSKVEVIALAALTFANEKGKPILEKI